jgi:hypothetical protein
MFPYVLDTNSMLNQEKGGDEVQRRASGAWYECVCVAEETIMDANWIIR